MRPPLAPPPPPTSKKIVKVVFILEGSPSDFNSGPVYDALKNAIAAAADVSGSSVSLVLSWYNVAPLGKLPGQFHRARRLSGLQTQVDSTITPPDGTSVDAVNTQLQANFGTQSDAQNYLNNADPALGSVSVAAPPSFNVVAGAKIMDDPHVIAGDGDAFDFKGEDMKWYNNLLSHANISVNALFQYADYIAPGPRHKRVHGSYMRAAFVTVLTNESRTVQVEYAAARPLAAKLSIDGTKTTTGPHLKIDNVMITLKDRTLSVQTPEWVVRATSKVNPSIVDAATCATGRCILNVQVNPLFDIDHAKVAPHGLMGQSYDADGVAVIGKVGCHQPPCICPTALSPLPWHATLAYYTMMWNSPRVESSRNSALHTSRVASQAFGFSTTPTDPSPSIPEG